MKEYQLSERSRLVVYDDGHGELFQEMQLSELARMKTPGGQGYKLCMVLSAEETEGLRTSLNAVGGETHGTQ